MALVALWLLSGVYLVAPEQQAVVTRFGAVIEPRVMPGIHYALPWPIDRVTKLKVQQLQRLVVGGDIPDSVLGRTQPLAVAVDHRRPEHHQHARGRAVFGFGPDGLSVPIAGRRRRKSAPPWNRRWPAASRTRDVDAVLTTEKAAIQEEVRAAAQKRINDYRSGVLLSTINIESVTPPPEAADAFRDVASARADAVRIVNQAEGYANDVIPKARGEARQLIESVGGLQAEEASTSAAGDAARFTQLEAEYAKAAQVTGDRLYIETMEQILPRIKKMIVDKNGNLDLTILRKGDPPPAPKK